MKITKNSAVKFVATIFDRFGIEKDKTFSFSIMYCHVIGSKDNANFNKFNDLVEFDRVKEIKIAGEVVKDIPKALEIIKEETSKWEKVKYFKNYRVARHDFGGDIVWLKQHDLAIHWDERFERWIESSKWDYLVSLFGNWYSFNKETWKHDWYRLPILDNYFVYENNIETGKFSKMSDEHQVKFRNDVKELFIIRKRA